MCVKVAVESFRVGKYWIVVWGVGICKTLPPTISITRQLLRTAMVISAGIDYIHKCVEWIYGQMDVDENDYGLLLGDWWTNPNHTIRYQII